ETQANPGLPSSLESIPFNLGPQFLFPPKSLTWIASLAWYLVMGSKRFYPLVILLQGKRMEKRETREWVLGLANVLVVIKVLELGKNGPQELFDVLQDVYEGELTFRVDNEAITYNLDQTLRYSVNYNDMTANRINVVELACEEYSQEVLGFLDVIASGNPTPYYDLIVSNSSPTLIPFGDSDFLLLEEADAFLALADDPTSPEVDESYYDSEGDILILEALLNSDPSSPPNQGNYLPEIKKELKIDNLESSIVYVHNDISEEIWGKD
ncbi:hypothetical protein Tco_0875203, partial [Tanacetum coccineum]